MKWFTNRRYKLRNICNKNRASNDDRSIISESNNSLPVGTNIKMVNDNNVIIYEIID